MSPVVIHWFRRDLRLGDNPALTAAVRTGATVVPVYVLDEDEADPFELGGASRWWLHGSLASLDRSLREKGSRLILRRGDSVSALMELAASTGASAIYVTRGYEPRARAVERSLNEACAPAGLTLQRFGGSLLWEPEAIKTGAGAPFRVFTPFYRACRTARSPAGSLAPPQALPAPARWPDSAALPDWGLLPKRPDWAGGLRATWQPGEAAATERLTAFLSGPASNYADDRNRPDEEGTSRLSPYLHFGEISVRQCWNAARAAQGTAEGGRGIEAFLRELVWREFSAHLLFHFPRTLTSPFRPEFERFPQRLDAEAAARDLAAWRRGRTGFPIVDAGMRQLWQTGWMHNRVRMIAASLLTKHLLLPWQEGARWFFDTLVDADLASNTASWQWVAGSGADAAPYFRVFNPVLQGAKFDPAGDYVRRFVPELGGLPAAHIHAPWEAPAEVLAAAGVRLGENYPLPIVEHRSGRARALAAYDTLRADGQSAWS
jgi:deoxyribodipyrimidine photo-lyase